MNDNFTLDITGALEKSKSQKQINSDIKELEKVINMLRLTGTFATGDTKKELNSYIKSLQSQLDHIKLKAEIDSRNIKNEFNKALNNITFEDIDLLNIDENKAKLKVKKIIADAKAYAEKTPITINIESKKTKLNNDLITYLNRNTKINESSVLLNEADKVQKLIDAVDDNKTLREATDAFRLYKSEVSATGYNTKSTTDKIKGMITQVTKIGSTLGVASMAVNKFSDSMKTLKTNDTILTEISKTSELTIQQLAELGNESFKTANKYGQLSSNYLLGVQEMARSGYESLSKELGELSLLAQSAGDMTADMANNYLLATDAAYKYNGSVEKLNAALDGANYISNKNSASLTDIADATQVSASFAANANVAIDELTAAEATMIAVTKRSGSEMGRAFRSILLNLQQVSGEFDGEVIDEAQLKKVEETCHNLGVELEYVKDGVATLRDPMEVLKELSEVYNSLPDNSAEKQGLISDIGGKYHANALSALLSRWDMYEKMLGEFSQGTGSALEEANKTADSWEGRLAQLQNSWDSFVNSIMNKEAVLSGISFFDRMIQGAETLTDTIGEIPTVIMTLNTAMTALNKDYGITQLVNPETKKLDIEGNVFGIDFTAIKTQRKHFDDASKAISGWNSKLSQGLTDVDDFSNALVKSNAQFKAYLQTTSIDAPASLSGYKAYLNSVGVSTDALRLKTILLNTVIGMGIGIAIQAAVQGITYLIQREEELRQQAEEAAQAYKESASSIDDYVSRYQELRKALIAAKGDEEETYNIKKQLLDLQTEINNAYGEEYGKLDLVTNAYRDQTEAIKDYNKELANNYLNENEKGIHEAEKQMTKNRHYNLSYSGMVATTDKGKALKEIAEKYKDKGINLLNEGDGGVTFSVYLNADAESAYDVINDFETDLRNKAIELGDEHLFDDVLEMSSNSLNNAKSVIDDYGEIFKRSLIAKIASDDSKATVYNDALKAVEEYNNAVLASEDPYSDEKVTSARQNLEDIKQSIQSNTEEWGQYSSVMDDVFDQADTRLIDFNNRLQNDDSFRKYAEELKGLDVLDLQSFDQNVGENNAFDQLKESAGSCGVSVEELIDRLVELGYVQDEIAEEAQNISIPFSQRFKDLWDLESFSDTRKELQKLSKEAGITEDDIYSLARENEELASLLTESGISAQFAATCFNRVCDGADGFSAITEDARALDQVLHGMDESLQSVAASKSAYDKAMEQDDYNSDFENYQEAYKSAMEMFENGDYGKHFRSAMEYLLGDESYTMSIEEMKNAMDGLKNVFGEDAANGLEFLDKLYAKKEILDSMDSSLEKLSDGSYDFDLKPDDFEAIGEAIGMTADEVAACTNALGMFGDYHSYDLEELEEKLNNVSIAAKDGEKSILSLQGVESILSDLGYNGYEIYHILEDIKGMGSLELLDFNASDSEGLQTVIDKLSELKMLKIDGKNIDVSGLADKLKDTFGMTIEDIQTFLASLGKSFDFTDSMGTDVVDAYSNIQDKIKSIQAEIASGSYSADEIVQMQAQLEELQRRADALREPVDIKLTSNIDQTKEKLEEVTRKYDELKQSIASKQEQGITVTYGDTNALNELANQKAALEEQLNHYNELKVTVEVEREQADADIKDLTSDKETKLTVNFANKGEIDAQFSQWMQPKSTTLKVNVTANDPNGLLKGGTPTAGQTGNSGTGTSSTPVSGKGKALGNAQIGHSFADGTIGAPKTETALINELGNETIIDPQSGTYEIVEGGAQFRKIKKGQIILNHLQTKALQKYGKISSFGKMLFGGNAKLKGSAYPSGTAGGTNPATKKPYQGNNSTRKTPSQSNSDSPSHAVQEAQEATEEFFDWIERRIKKFQAAFDKWIKQAETAVTSGFINKYYKKATSAIKNELSTYGKAYKRYMKQADSIDLSKKYRDKVKNGTIDIETIKDEKLAEQIKKYQEWCVNTPLYLVTGGGILFNC